MTRPTDFHESLRSLLATNSRDWGMDRADAWIWGIVHGWDTDPEDLVEGFEDEDAMRELAARHGWDAGEVARLRALHAQFVAAAPPEYGQEPDPDALGPADQPTPTPAPTGNCGLPDGVLHPHAWICWRAGYAAGRAAAVPASAPAAEPVQSWQRPLRTWPTPSTEPGVVLHLQFDDTGRAVLHEAVLAQLLIDAGWERTR